VHRQLLLRPVPCQFVLQLHEQLHALLTPPVFLPVR
jgi:hypothetical protein